MTFQKGHGYIGGGPKKGNVIDYIGQIYSRKSYQNFTVINIQVDKLLLN